MNDTLYVLRAALAGASLLALSTAAVAGAGHGTSAIGKPGKQADASRTVEIILQDNAFEPERVQVRPGETIRFVLKNKGELLHEFNLGTPKMHAAHQKEMAQMMEHGMLTPTGVNRQMMQMDHGKAGMPAMKHDDPNTVLVEPGKTKELTWTFPNSHDLEFACNIPGHYESGMVGKIKNVPAL
jgi:uncharacterized cupredoxin-like copper-binding protein